MKWKSKATGITFNVFDGFYDNKHVLAIFNEEDGFDDAKPRARLSYAELLESFNKVSE